MLVALLSCLLGFIAFLLTIKSGQFLFIYTRKSKILRYYHGNSPYALITGSSDGIGLGFARALAARGFNVVLHGRNPAKLNQRKTELNKEFPNIRVRCIIADATALQTGISQMLEELEDLNLTILINNIGGVEVVMYPAVKSIEQTAADEVDAIINLNMRFASHLTGALWPKLTGNGPSLVLNIGSMGDRGMPFASTYSGTKAYNMAWSKSLRLEAKADGRDIEVLGILVGVVTGVTHRKVKPSLMVPTASRMAQAALARVGCGKDVVVGYFWHAVQQVIVDMLPDRVFEIMITKIVRDIEKEQNSGR